MCTTQVIVLYKTAIETSSASAEIQRGRKAQTNFTPAGGVDRSQARFTPASGSAEFSLSNIGVDGVPTQMLADWYQGLALNLAHEVSRARIECIRISGLKAFNDRQSVMYLEDELEKLRADVIEKFELPVNEKILQTAKAHVVMPTDNTYINSNYGALHATSKDLSSRQSSGRDSTELIRRRGSTEPKLTDLEMSDWQTLSEDAKEQDSRASRASLRGTKKFRFIIMTNNLFFDPEIFGAHVSVNSGIIRAQQLHAVYPKLGSQKTLVIEVQEGRLHGLDLLTGIRCYEISFNSVDTLQQVLQRLREMCIKADERRQQQRYRYFESSHMLVLLEKCSCVHQLRKGMSLPEAASTDSLFVVRTGYIKMKRFGSVYREIFEGECFGATEFVERNASGRFTAVAAEATLVLELRPSAVDVVIKSNDRHACLLYCTLCKVMDVDYREAMEEMFPGTWSRKTIAPLADDLNSVSQVQRAQKKRALQRAMNMMSGTYSQSLIRRVSEKTTNTTLNTTLSEN